MNDLAPLVELTRGDVVESVHYGAIAVVDSHGQCLAHAGNPDRVVYMRSASKPLQAIPLVEMGAADAFGFTPREIAVACASHSGAAIHTRTVAGILDRLGLDESALMCGVHPPVSASYRLGLTPGAQMHGVHAPTDEESVQTLIQEIARPTPLHNNCSGKHAGMLTGATWLRRNGKEYGGPYIDPEHPLQRRIRSTWAEMAGLSPSDLILGIDGCSAPNYALPLRNAAWALARVADPSSLPPQRAAACRRIFAAMTENPEMVSGEGGFDTDLLRLGRGRWIAKGGAEGYQVVALAPEVLGPGRPGAALALKVIDGNGQRATNVATVAVLRQLGVLNDADLAALGAVAGGPLSNWRGLVVGQLRPVFELQSDAR